MTKRKEIYKCEICGNVVEILHEGQGELVCCNQPMKLQEENTEGEYAEKHAPIVEDDENDFLVKIGNIPHPMEDEHYIEWIEATSETGEICKVFLNPKEDKVAEARFLFQPVSARMYCNKHGLWTMKEHQTN